MAFVQSTHVANFGIYDRLSAALSSVKVALQRRAIFSQTIRELQNLSNRELADIGINRKTFIASRWTRLLAQT